ncbi:MAG: hypothetical protein HC769_33990 [Cyanobacteria bacterium CRU_2_1]|nr:hypothetical protein [Cyanobacteria bacterium CRU_2_1]
MSFEVSGMGVGGLGADGHLLRVNHKTDALLVSSPFSTQLSKRGSGAGKQDVIVGSSKDDRLSGSDRADVLRGKGGSDRLWGRKADDVLEGGTGNDALDGGEGDDTLLGGSGNDTLVGGAGTDLLIGGQGQDVFILDANAAATDPALVDVIADFTTADRLQFSGGLKPSSIVLEANGADTVVKILNSGKILVRITGVSPSVVAQQFTDRAAPEIATALVNDTGITKTDRFTADATIAGTVKDNSQIVNFRASFQDTDVSRFVDVKADLQPDGSFRFTPQRLSQINGGALPDGIYSLHLLATDQFGNTSETEFKFTLAVNTLFFVSGDISQPKGFTASDLAQLPRTSLTVNDQQGKPTTYEGVLLTEIFKQTSVPQGDQLRGTNLALYLVVEAADGYQVVYDLPEFDPAFGNRTVLLSDRRDGQPLAGNEGPLRLVIPGDQRQARWIRQIIQMRVLRVTSP